MDSVELALNGLLSLSLGWSFLYTWVGVIFCVIEGAINGSSL